MRGWAIRKAGRGKLKCSGGVGEPNQRECERRHNTAVGADEGPQQRDQQALVYKGF